ncbi:MAG: ABC transporter permease [Mesorhizobium sp.]|uniref:ABC transporter permease n=1 Tax=Mesorhizobium sp. TaxID=1871066 RepID=UPI00121FE387|nr:ABC transporter permease [Mesorhizobium sp.]TIL76819.1 MAG: ABC transporter permease [Mesorhizobium sp.]TIL93756.1 MAG: ABC transporter permease [Mesorhizobium sp.]TIM02704.1 MAG: ABC transporter permease [Mesorhizobium sp.]TIM23596.1 MAG: ABC transporter permease [Mesorhizobium sp.]
MLSFIARRSATGLLMLVALSVLIFILLRLAPGDPIDAYINPSSPMSASDLEVLRDRLGLDQPLPVQYLAWLRAALGGDFGYSIQRSGVGVLPLVMERIGPTALLMGTGLAIAIVLGISAGIFSAVRRNTLPDIALSVVSFVGISSPAFLTALLGLYFFSVLLRWAPSGGMQTAGAPFSVADVLAHLVLPACLLSIGHAALIMRYMRASLLEVLNQDYVRTARAKGVREFWVIIKHATRNALLPVITLIGSTVGIAIGGAIFLESVFNWPGMGLLLVNAVGTRDYPVIMGATLVIGICVILVNLLTDIFYAVVDPRIQVS